MEPINKKCSKCGEVKDRSAYMQDSRNNDGLIGYCRSCYYAQTSQWRADNPDKAKDIWRRSRENNIEKARDKDRKYAKANPDKNRAKSAVQRSRNPDKIAERKVKANQELLPHILRAKACQRLYVKATDLSLIPTTVLSDYLASLKVEAQISRLLKVIQPTQPHV